MKSIFCLLTLSLCAFTSIHAADTKNPAAQESVDEVAKVDQLIKATDANLTRLKSLRDTLVKYKQAEAKAIKDQNDTDNLLTLVNLASEIQDSINDSALQDYFTPQFLEELKKFAQISNKKNIPQAK